MSLTDLIEDILVEASTTPEKKKKKTPEELQAEKDFAADPKNREIEDDFNDNEEDPKKKTNFLKAGRTREEIEAGAEREKEEERQRQKKVADAMAAAEAIRKASSAQKPTQSKTSSSGLSKEELVKKVSEKKVQEPTPEATKPVAEEPKPTEPKSQEVAPKRRGRPKKVQEPKPETEVYDINEKPTTDESPKQEIIKKAVSISRQRKSPSETMEDPFQSIISGYRAQLQAERDTRAKKADITKPSSETTDERRERVQKLKSDLIKKIEARGGTTDYLKTPSKEISLLDKSKSKTVYGKLQDVLNAASGVETEIPQKDITKETPKERLERAYQARKDFETEPTQRNPLTTPAELRKQHIQSLITAPEGETTEARKERVEKLKQEMAKAAQKRGGEPVIGEKTPSQKIQDVFDANKGMKPPITTDSVVNKIKNNEKLTPDELIHYNKNLDEIEDKVRGNKPKVEPLVSENPKPFKEFLKDKESSEMSYNSLAEKIRSGKKISSEETDFFNKGIVEKLKGNKPLSTEEQDHLADGNFEAINNELKKSNPTHGSIVDKIMKGNRDWSEEEHNFYSKNMDAVHDELNKRIKDQMGSVSGTVNQQNRDRIADILTRIHRTRRELQGRVERDIPKLQKSIEAAKQTLKAKGKKDISITKDALKTAYNAYKEFTDVPSVGESDSSGKRTSSNTQKKILGNLRKGILPQTPEEEDEYAKMPTKDYVIDMKHEIAKGHFNTTPIKVRAKSHHHAINKAFLFSGLPKYGPMARSRMRNPSIEKIVDEDGIHYDPKEDERKTWVINYSHSGGQNRLHIKAHTNTQAEKITMERANELGHDKPNINSTYNKTNEKEYEFTIGHEKRGLFGMKQIQERITVPHISKLEAEKQARREYLKKYKLKFDTPIKIITSHKL